MKIKLLVSFIIALFLGTSDEVSSQGLCDRGGGGFTLDKNEGCAPLRVTITNDIAGSLADDYSVNYDGKSLAGVQFSDLRSPYSNEKTVTYGAPGVFTILQKVVLGNGQFYACKTVKVLEVRPVVATYSSCGGSKIIVTLVSDNILNAYDRLQFDWGDGNKTEWKKGDNLTLEYTYQNTSIQPTIRITGLYDAPSACTQGFPLNMPVKFEQAQLQSIAINSVEMKGNGSMEINYLGLSGVNTDLKYSTDNGANYSVAATRTTGGVQIARINGLNTAQIYKVKLGSRDLCGGVLDSEVITSMVLKGSTANESNILSWNEYPAGQDFDSYEILRDGKSLEVIKDIKTLSFTDLDVQCGDNFEYQLIVTTKNIKSISAPVSVKTEVSSPGPITEASVTVASDDLIIINTAVPGASGKNNYEIMIEKADAGSTVFKRLTTLYNQLTYSDPDVEANAQSYCYRMTYRNACGQRSAATEPICTIHLSTDIPLIKWTGEKPFMDAIATYEVTQESPSKKEVTDVGPTTSFVPKFDNQTDLSYTFQITAKSVNRNFESVSNILSVNRDVALYLPSAFTPDGDGYNDLFQAYGALYKTFSMSVFNKWGKVVFHTTDIQDGWDGRIQGEDAPIGSYVYKITVVDILNQEVSKTGTFMLLR
ncbi:T9SS type B sorting domain-containing protein [Dyadobacter tibetensis]|uniref:T9SS type B sorting domain-containing protein n=1 Tax=Dyadobacter tibetensis TaxID=1211851 RepID=UPI0004710819|nr:gliding motility-associated C-terminal domain-containing protein [Dyadobacter tibetensis]